MSTTAATSGKSNHVVHAEDVVAAEHRIRNAVHRTPVMSCRTLDKLFSGEEGGNNSSNGSSSNAPKLYFKCENFQKTGSFKFRGALNAVTRLMEKEEEEGMKEGGKSHSRVHVVTQSSGNHGQALAACAAVRGVDATIVMPSTSPTVKKNAVKGYGATVVECEPTEQARDIAASNVVEETKGVLIHPNQDPEVIAGQGTIAKELLEELPHLDAIVAPVGGGGMIGGIAVWAKHVNPSILVVAAEPTAADDCFRSKKAGEKLMNEAPPVTIADGVKVSIGHNTWPIIRDLVDDVICVTEEEIMDATRLVWERMKLVIEPSSGVGVAAVLNENGKRVLAGRKNIAVVLCGGNVDLEAMSWSRK